MEQTIKQYVTSLVCFGCSTFTLYLVAITKLSLLSYLVLMNVLLLIQMSSRTTSNFTSEEFEHRFPDAESFSEQWKRRFPAAVRTIGSATFSLVRTWNISTAS